MGKNVDIAHLNGASPREYRTINAAARKDPDGHTVSLKDLKINKS